MKGVIILVIIVVVVSRLLQWLQLTGSQSKITTSLRTAAQRRRATGPSVVTTARPAPQIQGRPFPWQLPAAKQPPARPMPPPPSGQQPLSEPSSSSLDSSLDSSLPDTDPAMPSNANVSGPRLVSLTLDQQRRVMELMDQHFEVGAVRLVCDETDAGILDAQKTVRTLAGLPTF